MPSARDMWCCDECADNFDETQSDRIKWKLFVWMGIWSFTGTGRALKLYVHAANLSLAVPCFFRVSGFTGLMKVRVKWLLSLPQLNLNWENTWAVQICVLMHQGPHLKSRNNLVLHILGGFDGSQAALFYCIKYTLQIKSSKLQGWLVGYDTNDCVMSTIWPIRENITMTYLELITLLHIVCAHAVCHGEIISKRAVKSHSQVGL